MTGQCRADGLIDPDAIPGANIKAEQVDSAGTAFSTSATDVQTRGSAVKTAWAKLGGSYTTPDSAELLTVMDGVETDTASLAATLQKVSTHLSDYATAVAPIAKRLVELKAEAETFVAKALKGKTVGPWDPEHPANQGIVGLVQNFGQQFDDAHLRWDEYTPYVDENNDLLTKVAEQETKLSAASAECVNAINGLRTDMCLAEVQAVDYTAAVKANEPMPWGSTGRGDQSCSESFSSGMDDALQGTLDGLGGLIGYNSQTGGWGDGDWAAQSWKGFAESLGLIALMGSPPLLIAGALPKGILPDVVSDTARNILDQQKTLVEGFVGSPEDWRDDPAHAAGGAAFNIGTLFIPGAGEVGAGAKVAALGSRLAVLGADGSKLAAFGSKLATAGTAMVRVGDALGSLPGKALSGASDLLAGSRGGFANALRWLGDKIPTVKVSVEHAVETPDGVGFGVGRPHIEVGHPEPGSHWLHSVADRVDGGTATDAGNGVPAVSQGGHDGVAPADLRGDDSPQTPTHDKTPSAWRHVDPHGEPARDPEFARTPDSQPDIGHVQIQTEHASAVWEVRRRPATGMAAQQYFTGIHQSPRHVPELIGRMKDGTSAEFDGFVPGEPKDTFLEVKGDHSFFHKFQSPDEVHATLQTEALKEAQRASRKLQVIDALGGGRLVYITPDQAMAEALRAAFRAENVRARVLYRPIP